MKKAMLIGLICFTLGFGANAAISGDITATGKYWADQYTFFTNIVTMVNEIKTDVNAMTAELNGASTFDDITGFTFGTIATTDLTLTGL